MSGGQGGFFDKEVLFQTRRFFLNKEVFLTRRFFQQRGFFQQGGFFINKKVFIKRRFFYTRFFTNKEVFFFLQNEVNNSPHYNDNYYLLFNHQLGSVSSLGKQELDSSASQILFLGGGGYRLICKCSTTIRRKNAGEVSTS